MGSDDVIAPIRDAYPFWPAPVLFVLAVVAALVSRRLIDRYVSGAARRLGVSEGDERVRPLRAAVGVGFAAIVAGLLIAAFIALLRFLTPPPGSSV